MPFITRRQSIEGGIQVTDVVRNIMFHPLPAAYQSAGFDQPMDESNSALFGR